MRHENQRVLEPGHLHDVGRAAQVVHLSVLGILFHERLVGARFGTQNVGFRDQRSVCSEIDAGFSVFGAIRKFLSDCRRARRNSRRPSGSSAPTLCAVDDPVDIDADRRRLVSLIRLSAPDSRSRHAHVIVIAHD